MPKVNNKSGKVLNTTARSRQRIENTASDVAISIAKGSPLRYPGGKQAAIDILDKLVPTSVTEMVSPFVGGASFELHCAQARGIKVYAFDKFEPLINFWQVLKETPDKLIEETKKLCPLAREEFIKLQSKVIDPTETIIRRAAMFFAINRASFSGLTLSGGYSGTRFTLASIDKLATYDLSNIEFKCADFAEAIEEHPRSFLYLDPPYSLIPSKSNLYGIKGNMHRGFEHNKLQSLLQNQTNKSWILCYNDCSDIREKYAPFSKIETVKWTYSMSKDKTSSEIIIVPK